MENKKNIFTQHFNIQNILGHTALVFATFAANSRCAYIYHQPKLPDKIKNLRNF